MSIEKIVERIRKLRALSTSTNANEAAVAAAEAQRLMNEHRVEEAMLMSEAEQDAPIEDEDVLQCMAGGRSRSVKSVKWERVLLRGVAMANGCRQYTELAPSVEQLRRNPSLNPLGGLHVVGRKSDVQATKYLLQLFHDEVNRLADRWSILEVARGAEPATKAAKNSFKLGCAMEISRRLEAETRRMRERAPSNALMVIDKAMVRARDYLRSLPNMRVVNFNTSPSNVDGYRAGERAGREVDLGHGRQRLGEAPRRISAGNGS